MSTFPVEPITATDDEIRQALTESQVPPLLSALAYITGDLSVMRPHLRPDPLKMREEHAGLTPDQVAEARQIAFDVLSRFRDDGNVVASTPTDADLRAMMEFATGVEMPADYLPLLQEELSVTGTDLRAPTWTREDVAPDREFRVVVIGAGMSGLLAAYRLKQAGVDFVVLDKNSDVGGTWFENTYPGCRVDVANHTYSYSFAQRVDWPLHFSPQSVLLDYFRDCADRFELREKIQFNTEVLDMDFDEDSGEWSLRVRSGGHTEIIRANAVVSAVGQLNRPNIPKIDGLDSFAGPVFHSAQWRHDVDLTGKKVAVVGTGASAIQFIPVIAEQTKSLEIFQRTPNWFFPVPHYHAPVERGLQWLFRHVPSYAQWYRFWLFWRGSEGVLPACTVDPAWSNESSVSALNEELRVLLAMYIQMEFADRPDLLEKVLPTYPPASKRIVVDNGVWAKTLKRDNVRLTTDGIAHVTAEGIVDEHGELHHADVIILATGFTASQFLTPMQVRGIGGVELHDAWDGNARAYLGVTMPKFPNFFMLYGPNTNIVVNGSIIYFSECEVNYVMRYIEHLLKSGVRALDVKNEVFASYNDRVDEGNRNMVWGVSKVNSWYKSASGRVAQNWPFSLLEFWQRTRRLDADDYVSL